jgi:hypothetical protein
VQILRAKALASRRPVNGPRLFLSTEKRRVCRPPQTRHKCRAYYRLRQPDPSTGLHSWSVPRVNAPAYRQDVPNVLHATHRTNLRFRLASDHITSTPGHSTKAPFKPKTIRSPGPFMALSAGRQYSARRLRRVAVSENPRHFPYPNNSQPRSRGFSPPGFSQVRSVQVGGRRATPWQVRLSARVGYCCL